MSSPWALLLASLIPMAEPAAVPETLWLEAEHMDGIRGFCWPMGKPEMKKTDGHWGLSGPGWAAEWNQGGESGFLSIACGPGDSKAIVSKTVEIPAEGRYYVWVRYADWREKTERFQIRIQQPGSKPMETRFGERAKVDEDNEAKLYWGWAFVWDHADFQLAKGEATISLISNSAEPVPRQVDVIVLTTDASYRPRIKDRPRDAANDVLREYRERGFPANTQPLHRRTSFAEPPESWRLRTFADRGFLYLWNINRDEALKSWLSDDPKRVPVPYTVGDKSTREAFEKMYSGNANVPIFGDPRVVPTFHGVGPIIFETDAKSGELTDAGVRFAKWLEANPSRQWAGMMNYAGEKLIGPKGIDAFQKYRNRYVGSIAGESLGYFYIDKKKMEAATANAKSRRELAAAFSPLAIEENRAKYRKVYGKDLEGNAFADVISCLSVGNIVFAPLLSEWGSRTLGYESSAATHSVLGMRWAFMRGLARQGGHTTATYRSCNFGDSSTIFSNTGSYHSPQNLLDNYYSVFSGAGMTWYKFDIWYQYMAGSSMFYHEQGFDEFWQPGGTTAAGIHEVQLSPKGKLVDRFLRTTAKNFDRGAPYTPVAFLVDYAHGWEPAPYWPNSFKNFHEQPERFRFGDHERMLQEYFWTAYYPIGPETEKPMTGTNEVFVPGVFGDMFDVIAAYPDTKRWTTIDTYPVVIVAGEIAISAAEGKRLAEYVQKGGTLLVADSHLTGPGVAELRLPAMLPTEESSGFKWLGDETIHPSAKYRFRPIHGNADDRVLAMTYDGKAFCRAFDRGQGRLIVLSVPHGLTIGRQAHPVLPRLFVHLTRGLMPVEVRGDVQWLVNRNATGWMITLLNPAGQMKPQQGITPTDYRENRTVTIVSKAPIRSAVDRLLPDDPLTVTGNSVKLEVPAGGVRIVEIK